MPERPLTSMHRLLPFQPDAHPRFENYMLHMQGTAMLLAAIWKLTGDEDYGYLQVIQTVLGALMVLVVFRISMRLFATAIKAPPSQPTRMAKTTSRGRANAIATSRGNTR